MLAATWSVACCDSLVAQVQRFASGPSKVAFVIGWQQSVSWQQTVRCYLMHITDWSLSIIQMKLTLMCISFWEEGGGETHQQLGPVFPS